MLEPPKGHGAIPAAQSPGQTQGSKPGSGICVPAVGQGLGLQGAWAVAPVLGCDGDAASVRVVAGAGIQLEAGWSSPSLAKSAEFHWLQVAFHFVNWQKYKCLFFSPLC